MKKKGSSQVDWAVSMAIFLMYLAWFFIFIRPTFQPDTSLENLALNVQKDFVNDILWSVDTVPLFVKSSISKDNLGIIAGFPFEMDAGEFAFKDNRYYAVDDERLIFLSNVKNRTNVFWIAYSDEDYPLQKILEGINANESAASVSDLRAEFSNGVLKNIYSGESRSLWNIEMSVNDEDLVVDDDEFGLSSISAKYKFYSQLFDHTSYVITENPVVYNFIDFDEQFNVSQYNMTIKAVLRDYKNYFANNEFFGKLNFSLEKCESYSNNYIDFYSRRGGLSFMLPNSSSIMFCAINNTIEVEIEFRLSPETRYRIISHSGTYNNTLKYIDAYTTEFGVRDIAEGVSIDKLNDIGRINYESLKRFWNFPDYKDFSLRLVNDSDEIFVYDEEEPDISGSVYAKNTECSILDKFGNRERCEINVKTW